MVARGSVIKRATSPAFTLPPTPPQLHLQWFASEKEGDQEVQRTMLELLNQLDGFSSNNDIKVCATSCVHPPIHIHMHTDQGQHITPRVCVWCVCGVCVVCVCDCCMCGILQVIAATNRVDILDPALL